MRLNSKGNIPKSRNPKIVHIWKLFHFDNFSVFSCQVRQTRRHKSRLSFLFLIPKTTLFTPLLISKKKVSKLILRTMLLKLSFCRFIYRLVQMNQSKVIQTYFNKIQLPVLFRINLSWFLACFSRPINTLHILHCNKTLTNIDN